VLKPYLLETIGLFITRGVKLGAFPALVMEVTQQHLYKEFCKCANTLGGNERGFLTLFTPFPAFV
jgi:hypothetical protein